MRDFAGDIAVASKRLAEAQAYLNLGLLTERLGKAEVELARPDLWDDPERATQISSAYARDRDDVEILNTLGSQLADVEALYDLGQEESDDSVEGEIEQMVADLSRRLDALELRALYSGEYDECDAVCEIHSGAGGTDAQDWAEMMLRMYLRWGERRGFEVEVDEVSPGQEAGILSTTFIVRGRFAYGMLTAEKGVHRLVRMSPFDSQHRRQTSFASFETVPFIEDVSSEVVIDEKDLRIDTYRSSGAGGQHVNVTDSAVRITHLPSGVVVSCQNERSQHQNKARAMQILGAKLAELQRQQRQAELNQIAGPQTGISWGNQIRNYVMAPYQMVKDERSGYETGKIDAVLDGDIDEIMESYLRWRREHGIGLAPKG